MPIDARAPVDLEEIRRKIHERRTSGRMTSVPDHAQIWLQEASALVLLEILDELRAIRLAIANPPREVKLDPCDGSHDVVGGLSPYCQRCGIQL